jgi:acyl-CoA thioester hydrolase
MTAATSPRTARPQPPRRSDFVWWTDAKLRNADTDQFEHVNHAVLCTFFEAGRLDVFAERAVRGLMAGANLAVVRLEVDFLREVHFPGRVEVGTRSLAVGVASMRFAQGLFVGDECVASGQAVCVLLHPETGRSQPVSEPLRHHMLAARAKEAA